MSACPCGHSIDGKRWSYELCCGPLHRRQAHAPTAEALMRSRFSAFSLGHVDYLLATHRPPVPEADARRKLEKSLAGTRLAAPQNHRHLRRLGRRPARRGGIHCHFRGGRPPGQAAGALLFQARGRTLVLRRGPCHGAPDRFTHGGTQRPLLVWQRQEAEEMPPLSECHCRSIPGPTLTIPVTSRQLRLTAETHRRALNLWSEELCCPGCRRSPSRHHICFLLYESLNLETGRETP